MSAAEQEQQPTLRESAKRALPFAALSGAMQIVLSVVGMFLLVRYFSPDQYGTWVLLIGFAPPLLVFTSGGHRQSLMRFLPAMETREARRELLWSVVWRRGWMALAAAVVLTIGFPWYAERFGLGGYRNEFVLLVPAFVCIATNFYAIAGLNTMFRQREVFLGSLGYQVVNLAATALGIVLQQDIAYFAAAFTVMNALYLLLDLVLCARYFGPPPPLSALRRRTEAPDERSYRRTSYVDDVGTTLLSVDISRYLLAAFADSHQVAIYAVAAGITERLRALMPMEIFRPLATVTFFGKFEESNRVDDVSRMFTFLLAINRLLTTAYLALFVPLGAPLLSWIFREEYGEAYLPSLFMLLVLGVASMPIGLVAQALKRPRLLLYSKLVVLLNLGLGIPLSQRYGALGMALATTVSELAKNVIVFGALRLEFEIRYPWRGTLRFGLAAVVVGVALWAIEPLVPVWAAAAIGALAWAAAVRLLRVLDADERRLAIALFPARLQSAARLLIGG